jgi:hypothetical protein
MRGGRDRRKRAGFAFSCHALTRTRLPFWPVGASMAAAAAPLSLVVTEALAPSTSGAPVGLPASDEEFTTTPFLEWKPATVGATDVEHAEHVELNTFQMVRRFTPRCSISLKPADLEYSEKSVL